MSGGSGADFMIHGIVKYHLFGHELWLTTTTVGMTIVTIVLLILVIAANRALKHATDVPGTFQNIIEFGMEMLEISDTATAYMYRVSQLGVYVYSVESGSYAQSAGLKAGDYILSVDGKEISSLADFNSAIDAHSVGEQVEISVLRGKTVHDFTITLTEYVPNAHSSAV